MAWDYGQKSSKEALDAARREKMHCFRKAEAEREIVS